MPGIKICPYDSKIRHSGDYDDFVYCDQEMIDEYLPKARDYVKAVKILIEK